MGRWIGLVLAVVASAGLGVSAAAEPPPHAPAHGYRHQHPDGVELVFEAHFGLYRLAAHAHHFFLDGFFFRFHDGRWQRARHFGGPWERLREGKLPGPVERFAKERGVGARGAKGPPGEGHRGPPGPKGPKGPRGKDSHRP